MSTRIPRIAAVRPVVALLLAALVAGCGWQLRGSYDLPGALVPIAVEAGGVGGALRESLRVSGALARATDEAPASRVEILEESDSRRVISVDPQGKVDEYELRYEVRWQLTAAGSGDRARRILIAPLTFSANRSYDFDAGSVLSRDEEERILVETMREDLAQRILFRLQGWRGGRDDAATEAETEAETEAGAERTGGDG